MPIFDPNAGFKVYKGDRLIYTNVPSAPSGNFGDVLAWFMKNDDGKSESETDKVKGLKLDAVLASDTAMKAVVSSDNTINVITDSFVAMKAVAASETAMEAVAASQTAAYNVAYSYIAMKALTASETAMKAVAASGVAMDAITYSYTAMKAIASSETAMNAIAASNTAMRAIASSEMAMKMVADSPFLSDTGWLYGKEDGTVKTFKKGKTIVFEVYTNYDSLDSNFYQDSDSDTFEKSSPKFFYYPSCKYPDIKQPGQILNKGLTLVATSSDSSGIRVRYL